MGAIPQYYTPCGAKSYHGFLGFDAKIVLAIASGIKGALGPK